MLSKFTWRLKTLPDATKIKQLSEQLSLTQPTVALLLQRGFDTSEKITQFLNPTIEQFYDPYLLHDMTAAIERIQEAILNDEKIVIYGDYDVDGLTSTTIMKEAIEMLGGSASWYIPNRFTDGYGPNLAAYKRLIATGAQLIITVDNGVTGKDEIQYAQAQGVDVVVTDHHELPEVLPEAVAVVHPRYPGSDYPFKDLSGAGVAFKVASALLEEVPTDLLDLAALGTVADLVSLTDENRLIVTYGLKVLQQTSRVGLQGLYQAAKIAPQTINETTIGFAIAPRLNALGRLGDANEGVDLLSTTLDEAKAQTLVTQTQSTNEKRQQLVAKIVAAAKTMATTPENQAAKTLIIAHEGWHEGVLGIVASHIVGQTGKPTIILSIDPETGLAKGSGRSVPDFHLFNSLKAQKELMTHFGGHSMALGLTLPVENIDKVHAAMEQYAADQQFEVLAQPEKTVDLQLQSKDCTVDYYQELQQLAPFGTDNPQPIFQVSDLTVAAAKTMGQQKQHLRLQLNSDHQKLTAVGFGFGDWAAPLSQSKALVDMIGTLNLNYYNQQTTLQFMLTDIHQQASAEAKPIQAVKAPKIQVFKQQQLTTGLFKRDCLYVFFKAPYLEKIKHNPVGQQKTLALFYDEAVTTAEKIIVVDQPDNFEQLNFFLSQQKAVEIIFAFFNAKPLNFQLPNRQAFSKALIYFEKHPDLQVAQAAAIAQYLQLPPAQLRFIFKVFLQLGFVKIEQGVLNIADISTKKDLTTAPIFKTVQQRLEVEQTIDSQSNESLNQQLQQRLLNVTQ
ncbi:single-stranded-DNA-specific exonuclease RecJ [Agrilactobacillus yilanensis]|uniref:Single-stranded-DNA-specific exonuclease RecJ n=1 Tax=Agrilactobacillus yilanensis TaxID=2485997 RepID=A0ABW4J937_9LACO|nr:single-stranded-DNA-specific exonuclease RecJ [Agrilactobacillus yilanensis]